MMSVKVHTKDVANKTSVFARFAKMRRKIWWTASAGARGSRNSLRG
jgi:hypothetical protein